MISIVEASEKDYKSINWTVNQTWPQAFRNISSEAQTGYMLEMMYNITSLTHQARNKGHRFCLAADNTGYVGFLSYEINYHGLLKTKIHKIFVLPTEQGKGIEKLLINKVTKIAKDNHNNTLLMNVDRGDLFLRFYESLGFCKTGRENVLIGTSLLLEDYVMEKPLSIDQYDKRELDSYCVCENQLA